MNNLIEQLFGLLTLIVNENKDRPHLISEFQQIVWNVEDMNHPGEAILRDLAYDLDFYEPNTEMRREDASYYADERLELEIESVLATFERKL